MDLSYKFEFRSATERQRGVLANVTVEVWHAGMCVNAMTSWQIRGGNQGPWAAAPSFGVGQKNAAGKYEKYVNYVYFWPKRDGSPNTENYYNDFKSQITQAYNAWVAQGSPAPQRYGQSGGYNKPQQSNTFNQNAPAAGPVVPALAGAGTSLAPALPGAGPAAPLPMPQGWNTGVDTQTQTRFYRDPQGNVYSQDDSRLPGLLGLNPSPAAAPSAGPNNPFNAGAPSAPAGWSPGVGPGPSMG